MSDPDADADSVAWVEDERNLDRRGVGHSGLAPRRVIVWWAYADAMRPNPKQGHIANLRVGRGETEFFQGGATDVYIAVGGALTVQGALTGTTHVDGILHAQGAIQGDLLVGPEGIAILQGVIGASVGNEGKVVVDPHPAVWKVSVQNVGQGRSATIDELAPNVRAMLPMVTSTVDPG